MADKHSTTAHVLAEGNTRRNKAPVFVLGSVRSGTTLLYHMLLSAGGFAVYRTESNAINLLEPRFGDLSKRKNRRKLMKAWLDSKLFHVSGLDASSIERRVLTDVTNGGNFLRTVMEEIARKQGVERWADCTPDHLACIDRIKQTIPDALIVHIIRDGRDVALSMAKQKWIKPLPWDHHRPVIASAAYWDWIVQKGRRDGTRYGKDYCEVRFEHLVQEPRRVLGMLSEFIEHDLDHDRIQANAIGSVSEPNTSFANGSFNPVGRWRASLSEAELAQLEGLIGETLRDLDYPLANGHPANMRRLRNNYSQYFDFKLWLKSKTPAGRFLVTRNLSWL